MMYHASTGVEGTHPPIIPSLFHGACHFCPFQFMCGNSPPRERQCHCKGCGQSYKPSCYTMIFCCEACCEKSGLLAQWEFLCQTSDNGRFKRLRENARKTRYRGTQKGRKQRSQEYITRYTRQKETKAEPKKPAVDSVPPVVVNEETAPVIPTPPELYDETREQLQQELLKMLAPEKSETKTAASSSNEDDSLVVDIIPRCCKRAGCDTVVVPRSSKTIKRFCSEECREALRKTLQGLNEAYRVTRCPLIRLLARLLRMQ